jgi:hypothetical protein
MYARRVPAAGSRFSAEELARIQHEVRGSIDALWAWVQRDVEARLAE